MNLDDRMKAYEEPTRMRLPIRMPVVIRCDGKDVNISTCNTFNFESLKGETP